MATTPPFPEQALPEWMTYILVTDQAGAPTWSVVNLPLTYYGPSVSPVFTKITLLKLFTMVIVDSVGNRWRLDIRRTHTPGDGNSNHHRDTTTGADDSSDSYCHSAAHGHSDACRNDDLGHHYCNAYNDNNQQGILWQCGCRRLWNSFFDWSQLSILYRFPFISICQYNCRSDPELSRQCSRISGSTP